MRGEGKLDRLDMGKLYIGIIAGCLLLSCYFLFAASGTEAVSTTSEDGGTELADSLGAAATDWTVAFYTTDQGCDLWLQALRDLSTPELAAELEEATAVGAAGEAPEYLKRARSYLEVGKEQFVSIKLCSLKQTQDGYLAVVSAEERTNTVLATQEYIIGMVLDAEEAPRVSSVYAVDTSGL